MQASAPAAVVGRALVAGLTQSLIARSLAKDAMRCVHDLRRLAPVLSTHERRPMQRHRQFDSLISSAFPYRRRDLRGDVCAIPGLSYSFVCGNLPGSLHLAARRHHLEKRASRG